MKRSKHGLIIIERLDDMAKLPEHWKMNNEAAEKIIDQLEKKIELLEEKVMRLESLGRI